MKDKAIRGGLVRGTRPEWMMGTGPYLGKIVNHLDPEYMGAVEVEILKIFESGNPEESSGYVVPCTYVSPFYGVTPRKGVTKNPGIENTQTSYGFWAIPPDIGVKVLVLMLENNYGFGYWIGCVQDRYMNFMVPGYSSTTYNDKEKAKIRPVGEYNKAAVVDSVANKGADPTQFEKPVNQEQIDILTLQGLIDDQTRGTNTSSARREVPSMVFGWSTPGILDRRKSNKIQYGEIATKSLIPFNRLGGSSFVMDDGDGSLYRKGPASDKPSEYANYELGEKDGDFSIPHNEFVKIRTRTGHQILLHNSEDLIYISNAKGTSWIELTSNGKIDVYAKDSISVHSETDINFKANRDINLEASGNINVKAREEMRIESGNATHWKVGTAETKKDPAERPNIAEKDSEGNLKYNNYEDLPDIDQKGDNLYIDVSKDVYFKIGTHPDKGDLKVEISKDGHISLEKEFRLYAKSNIHQKSDEGIFHSAAKTFNLKSGEDFFQDSGAKVNIKAGADFLVKAGANASIVSNNNFFTASAANHIKAGAQNFLTGASTNEINGGINNIGPSNAFGGAGTASNGVDAQAAKDPEKAILPEKVKHAFIPVRIPNHEPWLSHENLDPTVFSPNKTDSTLSIKGDQYTFVEGYIQEEVEPVIVTDTFRKGK